MSRRVVDYDRIADGYDQRYSQNRLAGVATALKQRLARTPRKSILDVGCGTGRWLSELAPLADLSVGLDRSPAMLLRVPRGLPGTVLVNGSGDPVPFRDASADFVYCVNVIHHLESPAEFVRAAANLVRPRGALAVVGLDPHRGRDRWYLYDYFPECRALDLQRYPSMDRVHGWMIASGLHGIETVDVERIQRRFSGSEVLEDYFLQRKASSQLAILPQAAWARGLHEIRQVVEEGEHLGVPALFEVDLNMVMVCGWRTPGRT